MIGDQEDYDILDRIRRRWPKYKVRQIPVDEDLYKYISTLARAHGKTKMDVIRDALFPVPYGPEEKAANLERSIKLFPHLKTRLFGVNNMAENSSPFGDLTNDMIQMIKAKVLSRAFTGEEAGASSKLTDMMAMMMMMVLMDKLGGDKETLKTLMETLEKSRQEEINQLRRQIEEWEKNRQHKEEIENLREEFRRTTDNSTLNLIKDIYEQRLQDYSKRLDELKEDIKNNKSGKLGELKEIVEDINELAKTFGWRRGGLFPKPEKDTAEQIIDGIKTFIKDGLPQISQAYVAMKQGSMPVGSPPPYNPPRPQNNQGNYQAILEANRNPQTGELPPMFQTHHPELGPEFGPLPLTHLQYDWKEKTWVYGFKSPSRGGQLIGVAYNDIPRFIREEMEYLQKHGAIPPQTGPQMGEPQPEAQPPEAQPAKEETKEEEQGSPPFQVLDETSHEAGGGGGNEEIKKAIENIE